MPTPTQRPVLSYGGIDFVHGDGIRIRTDDHNPYPAGGGNLVIEYEPHNSTDSEESWMAHYISPFSHGIEGGRPESATPVRTGTRPFFYTFNGNRMEFHDSWSIGRIYVDEDGARYDPEDVNDIEHYHPLDIVGTGTVIPINSKLITNNNIHTFGRASGYLRTLRGDPKLLEF